MTFLTFFLDDVFFLQDEANKSGGKSIIELVTLCRNMAYREF